MGSQRAQVGGEVDSQRVVIYRQSIKPTGYLFPSPYLFLLSSKKIPLLLSACLPVTGVLVLIDSPLFFWCRKGIKNDFLIIFKVIRF
jgi:hypothetical protein